MELLKDFDIQKYLDKKPPSNNSFTTKQEIKALAKTPMNKNFIKEKDDMVKVFDKITGDGKAAQELINQTSPVILKIKKHHNRPRPKVLAKKLNIKMDDVELKSMNTPAYPSGHSAQGYLIGMMLSDKHPKKKKQLMQAARDISYSRNMARGHYKSDSKFGEQIGKDMYKHIKNKI